MPAVGTLAVSSVDVTGGISKYTLAWTSSAGGAVSGNPFNLKPGTLIQVKFVPGVGGTQPTNNYTVTLIDTDGVDVLAGLGGGTNLSNAASKIGVPYIGLAATQLFSRYFNDASQLFDLVVAAAGAAKTGTVLVWMRIGSE